MQLRRSGEEGMGTGRMGSGHGRVMRNGAEHKSIREPAFLGAVNEDV